MTTTYDNWTPITDTDNRYAAAVSAPTSAIVQRPQPQPTRAENPYDAGIDQVRYWVGATLTAAVAALVGIMGLIIAHGIAHVPVLIGNDTVHSAAYGLTVALVALAAAALFDGMLHVAPRPIAYYSWIVALLTALSALVPFTTTAGLHSQIAFAAMNLAVGLTVLILVPMAAVNARR